MRKLAIAMVALAVLPACDYTTALVMTPEIEIDSGVIGLWQSGADADPRLLVLPLNPKECLVAITAEDDETMYGHVCLARVGELTLAQLRWIGRGSGQLPKDDQAVYQYAAYTVEGNTLTFRLLNPDVVSKDVATADALREAIEAAADDPNLFREPQTLTRVSK